jgi:hypothetical protein
MLMLFWCVSMRDEDKLLLHYLHTASRIGSEILELCKLARKRTTDETLFLEYLHNEILMLSLLNELDKNILDRNIRVKPYLETKILKCAKESLPQEYYSKFAERWEDTYSD